MDVIVDYLLLVSQSIPGVGLPGCVPAWFQIFLEKHFSTLSLELSVECKAVSACIHARFRFLSCIEEYLRLSSHFISSCSCRGPYIKWKIPEIIHFGLYIFLSTMMKSHTILLCSVLDVSNPFVQYIQAICPILLLGTYSHPGYQLSLFHSVCVFNSLFYFLMAPKYQSRDWEEAPRHQSVVLQASTLVLHGHAS